MPYPGFIKFCVLAIARVQRHRVRWNTGKQDFIPELFGANLIVRNRTSSAFLAIKAELVVICRTTFCMFQAVWQQQQSSFEWNREKLLLPECVTNQDHRKPKKSLRLADLFEQLSRMCFQGRFIERTAFIELSGIGLSRQTYVLSKFECLGDEFQV